MAARKGKSAGGAAKPKEVMETRVFKSGNSYAVRLPRLLYSGGEGPVYMQKLDDGKLLIVPKTKRRWPTGFFESFGNVSADFEAPSRPAASREADARDTALFEDE
jgi:virulence-associated protein VagC